MNLKPLYLIAAMFALLVPALAAQNATDLPEADKLRKLGLTDAEISKITDLVLESQKTIREARLDIGIYRAETEKLLLADNPDMDRIEKLLRQALEKELVVRMTEIRRETGLRKLLGDRRWALVREAVRKRIEAGKAAKPNVKPSERLGELKERLQRNQLQKKLPAR